MSTTMIKSQDVTNFLRFMVTMRPEECGVDEEDYVAKPDGTRLEFKGHPLQLFKEVITDKEAIIVNPFHEVLTANKDQEWFYAFTFANFTRSLNNVVRYLLKSALDQKTVVKPPAAKTKSKAANDDEGPHRKLPVFVTKAIAGISADVDEKMLTEFEQIVTKLNPRDVFSVYYTAFQTTANVSCGFFDDDTSIFTDIGIRVNSIKAFKKLYMGIFDITDPDDLSKYAASATKDDHCPKLKTTLYALYGLYMQINKFSKLADDCVINLDAFCKYLDNIPQYYVIAKWQKSAVLPVSANATNTGVPKPNMASAPWNTSVPPPPMQQQMPNRTASGVPIPAGMEQQMHQQQMTQQQQMMQQMPMQGMPMYQQPMQQQMMYPPNQAMYPQQQQQYMQPQMQYQMPMQQQQPIVQNGIMRSGGAPLMYNVGQIPMPSMNIGVPGAPWSMNLGR